MNSGNFTMRDNASVSGNTAGLGGGVYAHYGNFTMQDNASVSGNTASDGSNGGGVYFGGGTFTMQDNASVSGNTAGRGGGVFTYTGGTGSLTMRGNASVSDNTALHFGGGMFHQTVINFIMEGNSSVTGNTALGANGGGVCFDSGAGGFTMKDSASISYNSIYSNEDERFYGHGGGVYGSVIMLDDASIFGNTANNRGGGVFVVYLITMRGNASVYGNSAGANGGGVCVDGAGNFEMYDSSLLYGNSATENGGGVDVGIGTFRISGGIVYGNEPTVLEALRNIAGYGTGSALINSSGTAQYGAYSGTSWGPLTDIPVSPSGNNFFRNTTINVVEGVLQ